MKRSGPLPRRKPLTGDLQKHQEWQRRSREAAIGRVRHTPPQAAPIASRRRAGHSAGEAEARRAVRQRSGGFCEIHLPGCTRQAAEWHHRLRRSQGGRWEAPNGLDLCHCCHEAVTNTRGHRDEYERNGWVLRRHQDPATTPVLIRGTWWPLTHDGYRYPGPGVAA